MFKATDYEILRGVRSGCLKKIPLARRPLRVATLLNEAEFERTKLLVHRRTIFFEDQMHDWSWANGNFRFFARAGDVNDVLVVYAEEEVTAKCRFDPMTGQPLSL